ncbi:TPA: restriction endonuclease subunit S [Citrobacter braakii]|nr:restriction endonuclease subunit S [Citrobacter braakii]
MSSDRIRIVRLGDILTDSFKNGIYKNLDTYGSGTPILRITDFDNDGNLVTKKLQRLVLSEAEVVGYSLSFGDIVINRVNSLTHLGKSIIWKGLENGPVVYESNMMRVQSDRSKIDPEYLIRILQSEPTREYFKKVAKRAVAQCSINQQDIKSLMLPLPILPEQKKIAQILSTWDSAISVTEKLLTNSQQQKKALMQQLLTGKKRLLDENGVRFSGEWVRNVSLGSVVELRKGVQINKDTLTEYGKYPVINGGITPSGFTSEFNTATNTITISEGGNSCGFIAIQKTPFWCGGHCYAVVKTELDNAFMFQLLKFNELKIMGLRVGSGLPNIQKKSLELFTVTYPAIHAEQQKIASILSAADAEIATLEKKLTCLKDEKKALMQQLLTGKRRVVVDADAA